MDPNANHTLLFIPEDSLTSKLLLGVRFMVSSPPSVSASVLLRLRLVLLLFFFFIFTSGIIFLYPSSLMIRDVIDVDNL